MRPPQRTIDKLPTDTCITHTLCCHKAHYPSVRILAKQRRPNTALVLHNRIYL
jgi:hypothetical protein